MRTNTAEHPEGPPSKIITLEPTTRLGRIPQSGLAATRRQRFRILRFENTSGSVSWRVQGMDRQHRYIRENHADLQMAQHRQVELEAAFLQRKPDEPSLRATRLSDGQLRMAEAVFLRLDRDDELVLAVDAWLNNGRKKAQTAAPRLDDAVEAFQKWLTETTSLRPASKDGLRSRVAMFGNGIANQRLDTITPDTIESFLDGRKVSKATQRTDKRAISRFFGWCIERPRHWLLTNPAREVVIEKEEGHEPHVLTVDQCNRLMRCAEKHKGGRLIPLLGVGLFGGLRPSEAARLTWEQVNLADGEIRLQAAQVKTGRGRTIAIGATLKVWLQRHKGKPFRPLGYIKDLRFVRRAAGIHPWPVDVLRHTAISHHFRSGGSYGLTAEWAGNSEKIIKTHYQGRVSSEDTKRFYAIMPSRKTR